MNRLPLRLLLVVSAAVLLGLSGTAPAAEHTRDALRAQHSAAAAALASSPFGRPLVLESSESKGKLSGEVLVEIDRPIEPLIRTLHDPQAWCEVLMLNPNVAACSADASSSPVQLAVRLARRFDQSAKDAYAATFVFAPQARERDYTALRLSADKGPVGTRDYRLEVEALALDAQRSVLRMGYAYSYGLTARLATEAYLSTKGADKVGFTQVEGEPGPVGGLRGSVERNAMRYFLAIEARTAQAGDDARTRFERSLDAWLAAIARYPRQLQETDPQAYRKAKLGQFDAVADAGGA